MNSRIGNTKKDIIDVFCKKLFKQGYSRFKQELVKVSMVRQI